MNDTDDAPQLLLLDAQTTVELRGQVGPLMDLVREPTSGGLDEVAVTLQRALADRPVRAGVVAASADQAYERLATLTATLSHGITATIDVGNGVFAGRAGSEPAIGYLFPGQGADVGTAGGALTRRFAAAGTVPAAAGTYQQQIVASSVVALRVLSRLGLEATAAAGHSLGELTALHWAGAMDEPELLALVAAHSQIMTDASDGDGAMVRIDAGPDEVEPLLLGEPVVVAGYNTPAQTVVAGPADAADRVQRTAAAAGLQAGRIPVKDAFHSPEMAAAAAGLRRHLADIRFQPLERRVLSTVTGDVLPPSTDVRDLLVSQVCEPVRFSQALGRMADEVSLLVEVGPDRLLSKLAGQICPQVPVVPLATDSTSSSGVLCAVAAAYVLGAPIRHDLLIAGSAPHERDT